MSIIFASHSLCLQTTSDEYGPQNGKHFESFKVVMSLNSTGFLEIESHQVYSTTAEMNTYHHQTNFLAFLKAREVHDTADNRMCHSRIISLMPMTLTF